MNKIQSVTGILKTDEGVLLLKRKAIDFTYTGYCLPGGKVDDGESLADALIREVAEEVGLDIAHYTFYETHENDRFVIHFFFIETSSLNIRLNPEEFDSFGFYPINQLPENTLPITKAVLLKTSH